MNRPMNQLRQLTTAVGILLVIGTAVWALSQETVDAIGGAVAIGTAISTGEITPDVAGKIVKIFREDQLSNAEIWDIFKALLDTSVPLVVENQDHDTGMRGSNGRGIGAFVQAAHARGLRGRALAEAIHAEQARRGFSGRAMDRDNHGRAINIDGKDTGDNRGQGHDSRGRSENRNRGNK